MGGIGQAGEDLPEDVREIGPDRTGSIGLLTVKHAGAKMPFINQIIGFHELLADIKIRNPAVILKGC